MPDNKTVTFDAETQEVVPKVPSVGMQDGAEALFLNMAIDPGDSESRTAFVKAMWSFMLAAAPTPAAQSAEQEAGTWRDAIETAVQVLSHIEAGDDVFVGQASEAIAGLTAILHGPTIPPTFEQARDALCDALDAYPPKRDVAPVNGGERELGQVIDERDQYHDAAEKLADAIAKHFGVEIGEHSNLNCPWQNALDHIAQATKRAADAQQVGALRDHEFRELVSSLTVIGQVYGNTQQLRERIRSALSAALSSPAKVGTVAQVTPEEQAEINAALDRDDELACSSCGLTMAQSRALTAAKVGGDGREVFERVYCRNIRAMTRRNEHGDYVLPAIQDAWAGWCVACEALSADGGEDKRDAERLDFMIEQQAWVQWTVRDGSIRQCQVYTQDEDENYHILSGSERFFDTPREAIDAAIAANQAKGDA